MQDLNTEITNERRTRCEIWTRVMGYHRPVSAWNSGKQSEHAERVYFRESLATFSAERLPEPR